jgi:ATP-dependent helicase/nuclease subunit B
MPLPGPIAAALLDGDTVIASSARAVRAMRRLHAEEQRDRGLEAWQSPDILDWESWLNRLWQQRVRSGNEDRLLLTTLQEQQVWVRVVRPRIKGRHLISVDGVAELAQHAYGLLCSYGALDFLRGEHASGVDVQSFREWAQQFERECEKERWLSRNQLPLVLVSGTVEAARRFVLAGFDRMTPAQQQLVDALQGQGFAVDVVEADKVAAAEGPLLVKVLHRKDEMETCALWVRNQLQENRRIAVVVPDVAAMRPEITRIFHQVLAPETVAINTNDSALPFEFSLGVPLADVPMARSALLLLRWLHEPLLQSDISWLLLSGFLDEQTGEMLPVAEFDAKVRQEPMRQPEQDLESYLKSGSAPDGLRRRLYTARKVLAQKSSLTFAEWAEAADEILEIVGWPGGHALESEDFQVQARWSHLLDQISALAFDGRSVGFGEFLEVLKQQAAHVIFAPESRDAPVQIIGPMETAGLSFDSIWFLSATDARWPRVAQPHPLLPRGLQRDHKMPHADSTSDWNLAKQVTARLVQSSPRCLFSYAVQDEQGACRPSTLIDAGVKEVSSDALRARIGAGDYGKEDEGAIPPEEQEEAAIVAWPVELDAGGAEILRMQAACPFQAFASRRLAARPMEATDWGLEARERGSVVHRILETLWGELKTRENLVAARDQGTLHPLVEQHVQMALKKFRSRTEEHSWSQAYLDAEEERIVALIEEWLEYEAPRSNFTVEAGEEKLSVTVGELKLQVRVDRIDAVMGGRIIIDYKTGQLAAVSWDGDRPDEPQLPLYAGFGNIDDLKGVLLARVRDDNAAFIGRVEDARQVDGNRKLVKPPYSDAMLQRWQTVLTELGQHFVKGEADVDPKQYPKTCQFCRLPGLCRIAENDPATTSEDTDDDD